MKSRRLCLPHSVFFTAAVVVALSHSAFADGGAPRMTERVLSLEAAPVEDAPLPTRLADFTEDEFDLRDASMITLTSYPQGRLSKSNPFIDFSHLELGGYTGMVAYSTKFEADPDWIFGISGRVPIPGLPLGGFGAWGELWVSHITRDIPFYYPHSKGTWYGGAVGGDFDLIHSEYVYFRPRVGVMYAFWNDTYALQNGSGLLAGLQFGILWIKHTPSAALVLTPEVMFDGKSWIGFLNFGFSVDF